MNRGFDYVSRIEKIFDLPKRSTSGSAGYDFVCPEDIAIPPHAPEFGKSPATVKPYCIKTGVKAYMNHDEVLQLYLRSSAPAKLGLIMANSVGIIDSDYYNNEDNEGEIGFLVYNMTRFPITIEKGTKIGQGIFTKFLLTDSDDASGVRSGGFGSTGA